MQTYTPLFTQLLTNVQRHELYGVEIANAITHEVFHLSDFGLVL
jgi:hypothetical protein